MENFKCVRITVTPPDPWIDLLSYHLAESGFEGFQIESEFMEAYVQTEDFDLKRFQAILKEYNDAEIKFEITDIPVTNWNKVWESNFQPVNILDTIYIYAPFHEKIEGIRYPILLTPKMSFGTGHHATTRMVMESMLEMDLNSLTILDVGCGSGILSILAKKMGASSVLAIDIDDWCIANSLENVSENHCSDIRIEKATVYEVGENGYNVILANINRNTILNDFHKYNSLLNPGGHLLLSGFIKNDIADIKAAALSFFLEEVGANQIGEWCLLKFSKKA